MYLIKHTIHFSYHFNGRFNVFFSIAIKADRRTIKQIMEKKVCLNEQPSQCRIVGYRSYKVCGSKVYM